MKKYKDGEGTKIKKEKGKGTGNPSGTGKNRSKTGKRTKPVIYELRAAEWVKLCLEGSGIGLAAVWLCYRSVYAIPAAVPVAVFYIVLRYRETVEKNRQKMRLHFRDFLTSVHMAVRSGYALENAVRSACRDTEALYGKEDHLVRELEKLIRKLEYQIPIEQLFLDLGKSSGIREIQSFSEMISITKRTGGNLGKVLGDTWRSLSRRMDTEMEIETILSAKKYEQSVMSLMPAGMILYLRFAFPGFVEHLYGNRIGVVIMTAALLLYLGAFALGRWMVRIEV